MAAIFAIGLWPFPSRAAPAGTDIANTAQVDVETGGAALRLLSNTVHIRLGEVLDVRLAPVSQAPEQVQPGDTGHVSAFVLTNAGNGHESFSIAATVTGIDATIASLWIDSNGDGRFDEAADARVPSSGAIGPLISSESLVLFVVSNMTTGNESGSDGLISLNASSATGTGSPGTSFAGAGDGGSDAVVGSTTARASAETRLIVGDGSVTLTKSQTVAAPGGGQPARGSIITYTLAAHFGGGAPIAAARIADPIPTGTAYVPGSLRLDGAALTDAGDADAGAFDTAANAISVTLGDAGGPADRAVSFQVRIN